MKVDALYETLAPRLGDRLQRDVALNRFTTYRLGGNAALFLEVADVDDLVALAELVGEVDDPHIPVLPLGRGSNLVVSDHGFPGVVVHLGAEFAAIESTDAPEEVNAGGAAPLPVLANWAARRGLGGLEFAIAIPGSVGGGVRMNAGAHGAEIRDPLAAIRVFDLRSGRVDARPASELALRYRRSNLGDEELVLEATFQAELADRAAVRNRTDAFRRQRAATQPGAAQNAGSVFKNPPNDHAGRLVEAAGLKGFAVGGAAVSTLHANFFLAADGARAQDVYDLVRAVRERVADKFGVELDPEIRFVGAFDERAAA